MASDRDQSAPRYRFATRELLIMAGLAGLSGVASTAVNALGDAIQAILGFAGTTQWAAGLHVTLLLLAPVLVGKPGAATITGILKGAVELLSGNTHGMLVLLADIAAGLLIDLTLLAFQRRDHWLPMVVAGAIAAASNVFVFQLFASAPEDVLRYVWAIAGLAAASGATLGGLLAYALLKALRRAGLSIPSAERRRLTWPQGVVLAVATIALVGGGFALAEAYTGEATVEVTGACAEPYAYSPELGLPVVNLQLEMQGMKRDVAGTPLREIVAHAAPDPGVNAVIATATDGYAFFVTMDEIATNDELLLAHHGDGKDIGYDIVGAESPKAWVRNVIELRLQAQAAIELTGKLDQASPFRPADWLGNMDSARVDAGDGPTKYQGVPVRAVISAAGPQAQVTTLRAIGRDGDTTQWVLEEVMADDAIRIWIVNDSEGTRYAVGSADQEIIATDVVELVVE